jgi:hypothetical protein
MLATPLLLLKSRVVVAPAGPLNRAAAAPAALLLACAGYARRGLRSAIASATKEGITVQEVMQPPPGSLGEQQLGHGQGQHSDAAAAADVGYGAGADWARIAQEMRVVDAKWAASKGGRASESRRVEKGGECVGLNGGSSKASRGSRMQHLGVQGVVAGSCRWG